MYSPLHSYVCATCICTHAFFTGVCVHAAFMCRLYFAGELDGIWGCELYSHVVDCICGHGYSV